MKFIPAFIILFQHSEEIAELFDATQNQMSSDRTIFLGFISVENAAEHDDNDDFSSIAYSE